MIAPKQIAADFAVMSNDCRAEVVHLAEPGSYVIVPRGVWHAARVCQPTQMLSVTQATAPRTASSRFVEGTMLTGGNHAQ